MSHGSDRIVREFKTSFIDNIFLLLSENGQRWKYSSAEEERGEVETMERRRTEEQLLQGLFHRKETMENDMDPSEAVNRSRTAEDHLWLSEENRRLRKALRKAEMENRCLKRTAAFFARQKR